MSRHIIDRDHSVDGTARALRFLKIEREERPSPASRALQRRKPEREASARIRAYLRIEREAQ